MGAFVDPDESGFKDPEGKPDLTTEQRRMGLGKRGNTIEKIRTTVDSAGYNVGGAVTDLASKVLPPEGAAAAGYVANVATDALPAVFGGEAMKGLSPTLQSAARDLMQKALKPTLKDLKLGKADRAAQTLLDEGINVSKGGVAELRSRAEGINSMVDNIIGSSASTVDKGAVASRLQDVIARIEKTNWTPQKAREAVEGVYNEFLANPLVPKNIPVAQAQELKQGIYRTLKDKYGTLGTDTEEALKAGARGFKEELERKLPAVGSLNAHASDLWNALNVTERRALLQANNNPGGLSWLAHNPWTFAASMADRSGLAKSILSRGLYSGSEQIPATVGRVGGGILGGSTATEEGILSRRTSWMGSK